MAAPPRSWFLGVVVVAAAHDRVAGRELVDGIEVRDSADAEIRR